MEFTINMDAEPLVDTDPALTPVEERVAEYLALVEAGADPSIEEHAARFGDADERDEFRRIVARTAVVRELMPVQVAPGVTLGGRYRLVREIGSGGMGKVFEAEDTQLHRRVAVKVLTALGSANFDPEQLFMRESRLLAGLQHPNIVAVHEAGQDGDVHFAVMDLVCGTPLGTVLARVRTAVEESGERGPREGSLLSAAIGRPVPEGRQSIADASSWFRTVAKVVAETARTLEAAHAKGVIHRDVKPGNVLLRGDGSPVVLDFGLAGQLDKRVGSVTTGLMGSPAYLAPEQARSQRCGADPRTDVYQLGLLLYETLTLHQAFPDEDGTWVTMRDRISRGAFRLPRSWDSRLPPELEAICLKAMELDPRRRYQSATDLRTDLESYLSGDAVPVAARGGMAAGAARRARYFLRRHRVETLAAAALVLGLSISQVFGAPPAAQDLRAWAGSPDDLHPVADGSIVRPYDFMGVAFSNESEQVIYALSVWGGSPDRPAYVRAMTPQEWLDGGVVREPEGKSWGLSLPPGEHALACTQVGDFDPDLSYEGLWVFHGTAESESLEQWFSTLHRLDQGNGVEFGAAWERLTAPITVRGNPVVRPTAGDVTAGLASLSQAQLLGADDWPLEDPKRFTVWCRVAEDSDG